MIFNEQNTVENYIKDLLISSGWKFVPATNLDRRESDVLVENLVN